MEKMPPPTSCQWGKRPGLDPIGLVAPWSTARGKWDIIRGLWGPCRVEHGGKIARILGLL